MANDPQTLLRLFSIHGMGARRMFNLHSVFPDLADVFRAGKRDLCAVPGIDQEMAQKILAGWDDHFVETQLKILESGPFRMISYFDREYPALLRKIFTPPILLFLQGEIREPDEDAIAVVGTRKATPYGKEIATELVRGLVAANLTIVSGFARGIDTVAHRAALQAGGRTIAVLGNGVDRVYPPENRGLRDEIVKSGAYCSEFPFETKPDAVNFPRRNRIISGLSLGTIVVEAGQKSGALLTAYFANDQNREVFALPGRATDQKSAGCNRLIQKGAKLVSCVDDILDEIDAIRKFPTQPRQLQMDFSLEADETGIYDLLSRDPKHIDQITAESGKNTNEVLAILLSLELKGAVQQLAGKMFIRVG